MKRKVDPVTLEEQLRMLAVEYGRYPHQCGDLHGFAARDELPEVGYFTLEEAVAAEAIAVRALMVEEQKEIQRLQQKINARLVHLGVLEK